MEWITDLQEAIIGLVSFVVGALMRSLTDKLKRKN